MSTKNLFYTLLMSVFVWTSCNEADLDNRQASNNSEARSTSEINYVFAVKQFPVQTRAVGVKGKYWENGQSIRIKFVGPEWTAKAQEKVKQIGAEWLQYANLKFEYVTSGEADVKIGFGFNGDQVSWSYIGTDCKRISQSLPSMNISRHSDDRLENNPYFAAIILREYGHMLGLGFEHQGQEAIGKLNFNEDKLIAYFLSVGWDENQLYETLFDQYNKYTADHIRFDENSIMLLYFPSFVTTDGKAGKYNTKLSEDDKKFMLSRYPFKKNIVIDINGTSYQYEAIRIGEYWWMNSNFHSPEVSGITTETIARAMQRMGFDPTSYPVSVTDFKRYFGEYYYRINEGSYEKWFTQNCPGYDLDKDGNKKPASWGAPYAEDFMQLFGMCGTGNHDDVRRYLGCKTGDNPAAIAVPGVKWFDGNENVYGFNLMPGAARVNGYDNGYNTGDIYDIFKFARFPLHGGVTLTIPGPDYPHRRFTDKLWHWLNIRFCQKMDANELGYQLYINSNKTDIRKMKPNETPPYGYTELPAGYLRGFYVQYILDKAYPEKTIAEIVQMANNVANL